MNEHRSPGRIARALAAAGAGLALCVPAAAHARYGLDVERFDGARASVRAAPAGAGTTNVRLGAAQDHERRETTRAMRAKLMDDARRWDTLVERLDRDLEAATKQAAERDAAIRAVATLFRIAAFANHLAHQLDDSGSRTAGERAPGTVASDGADNAVPEMSELLEVPTHDRAHGEPVIGFGDQWTCRPGCIEDAMPPDDLDWDLFTFDEARFVDRVTEAGLPVLCDAVMQRCLPVAYAATTPHDPFGIDAGVPAPEWGEAAWASGTALEEDGFRRPRGRLGDAGSLASGALDLHPIAGPAKAFVETGTGRDVVTGERIPRWVAGMGLVPGVGGGVKLAVRTGGRWGRPLVRMMPGGAIARLAGKTGREAFGESGRAILATVRIESLGTGQLRRALRKTPFRWSDHALSQLRHPRVWSSGIATPGQIVDLLNNGVVRSAGGRSVAILSKNARLAVVVDVARRTVVTVKPWTRRR